MDPALLREREAFKKKAMQLPTVEKRKAKEQDIKNKPAPSKPAKRPKPGEVPSSQHAERPILGKGAEHCTCTSKLNIRIQIPIILMVWLVDRFRVVSIISGVYVCTIISVS